MSGVLLSLFPRSLQELNIRFDPPGITGIPPQPSDEEEDTKDKPLRLEDIKTPHAPGQMSPSVKLMPPGLFSSPSTSSSAASGNPSTYTTPTLPLRSPSDFESIPTITPQQTETNAETGNESSPTQANSSSQIVTVPLDVNDCKSTQRVST